MTTFDPNAFAALQQQIAALQLAKTQAIGSLRLQIDAASKEVDAARDVFNAKVAAVNALRAQLAQIDPSTVAPSASGKRGRPLGSVNANNPLREAVHSAIRAGCSTPKAIQDATGIDNSACWYHLASLVASGTLLKTARGEYAFAAPAPLAVPDAPAPVADATTDIEV
jgi:hypothetical protein